MEENKQKNDNNKETNQHDCDSKEKPDSFYFKSYSNPRIHKIMIKDKVRTTTYRDSMYYNKDLFEGKTVLDVGCGTGILSMFAAKAGAARVIGIDASDIADNAKEIVEKNNLSHIITIVKGKVEDVTLPHGIEKVDIIISEWMGFCLLIESMLDTVIFARDKWLKKDGMIFPDRATLYLCGADDFQIRSSCIDFLDNVYDFDMSSMSELFISEAMVDFVYPSRIVTGCCSIKDIDLYTVRKEDLEFSADFYLTAERSGRIQILFTFFKVEFTKCHSSINFSTSPEYPRTHWKQTIFYLKDFISVEPRDQIKGKFILKRNANNFRTVDCTFDLLYYNEGNFFHKIYDYLLF